MIILKNFFRTAFFLLFSYSLIACNSEESSQVSKDINVDLYSGSFLGQQFNNILLAELYNQQGEAELSVKHFQLLTQQTSNPELLQRATVIAAKNGQLSAGLQFAQDWVSVSPENLEARQYFALLLLRNETFDEASKQLHLIQKLVIQETSTETSTKGEKRLFDQGLRFIGSMLSVESHHKKALTVFQRYLQTFGSQVNNTQQNLILASLAMKAEKYEVVISSFQDINNVRTKSIPEIVMMKTKALQKLNRTDEAANTLKQYIEENKDASDSTRLELVRLLILVNQKNTAVKYLKALVAKHPDNRDLLKSLIALDIDRSELEIAKNNIELLKQSEDYLSDADYFTGEILEAEGQIKNALRSYQRVNKGALLKRAKQKILVLNKKIGRGEAIKVNYNKKEIAPSQ